MFDCLFKFFIYLLWLCLGLHCCTRAFLEVAVSRTSIAVCEFSLQWLILCTGFRVLQASAVVVPGDLDSAEHVESSQTRIVNPCPLHWHRFSTTEPPRKSVLGLSPLPPFPSGQASPMWPVVKESANIGVTEMMVWSLSQGRSPGGNVAIPVFWPVAKRQDWAHTSYLPLLFIF